MVGGLLTIIVSATFSKQMMHVSVSAASKHIGGTLQLSNIAGM